MGIFVLIWVIGFAFVVCGLIASIYTLVKVIERHETGIIVWGAVGTACGVLGIFFAGIVFGTISLICGLYGKSLLDKTGDNPSFEQYKREQAMKNDPQYQAYLRSIGQAPAAPAEDDFGLSAEEITRLRMKAKRNELTEDERLLYTEYLQSKQRGM